MRSKGHVTNSLDHQIDSQRLHIWRCGSPCDSYSSCNANGTVREHVQTIAADVKDTASAIHAQSLHRRVHVVKVLAKNRQSINLAHEGLPTRPLVGSGNDNGGMQFPEPEVTTSSVFSNRACKPAHACITLAF